MRNEMTLNIYVENPKWEQPREPTNSKQDHYRRGMHNGRLGGNDLELCVFANWRLQKIKLFYVCVCVSLSVCVQE